MRDDASNELDFTDPKIDWHRDAVPPAPARPPAAAKGAAIAGANAASGVAETAVFQPGELRSLLARGGAPARDPATAAVQGVPHRSGPADRRPPVGPGAASLVAHVEWPSGALTRFGSQLNIGRDYSFCPAAAEMAEETHVSRRHAVLEVCAGGVRVCDLGSRNGTFVDGVQVPAGQAVLVERDAQLRFGPRCVVPLTLGRSQ